MIFRTGRRMQHPQMRQHQIKRDVITRTRRREEKQKILGEITWHEPMTNTLERVGAKQFLFIFLGAFASLREMLFKPGSHYQERVPPLVRAARMESAPERSKTYFSSRLRVSA